MKELTLVSLFDGSGGFPLAASMCGITPVACSEVEPYPIAVTRSRFPNMVHLGDVSKVRGHTLTPVDVVSFGSPCQDLSVAGKRAGLKHEANGDGQTTRSGLFMEAVRIITEMREATNGMYPTFAVWENVPGALSSSGGDDFLAVLENLAKIADPEVSIPKPDKWCANGEIVGNGWSIAWRIIDARHFGVTVRDGDTGDVLVRGTPQRRRRIYLVADFRGARAGKILFGSAGVPWDSEPCAETRQGAAADVKGSVGDAVCYGISAYESNAMKSSNPHSGIYEADTSRTLDLNGGNPACNQGGIAVVEQTYCLQGSMIGRADKNGPQGDGVNEDVSFTCNTTDRHAVAYVESYQKATGPLMANSHPGSYCGQDAYSDMLITPIPYRQGGFGEYVENEVGTVRAEGGDNGGGSETIVAAVDCRNGTENYDVNGTLQAHPSGGASLNLNNVVRKNYLVRRLTPTECARLQGFPDTWGHPDVKTELTDEEYAFWLGVRNTHASINGKQQKTYTREQMLKWYNKLHTDSAEYKMWGNGIALPCAVFVMQGIAEELKKQN